MHVRVFYKFTEGSISSVRTHTDLFSDTKEDLHKLRLEVERLKDGDKKKVELQRKIARLERFDIARD